MLSTVPYHRTVACTGPTPAVLAARDHSLRLIPHLRHLPFRDLLDWQCSLRSLALPECSRVGARGGDSVHTTPSHVPVSHVAGFNPECKCRYVPPVVLSPRYNFLSSNTSDSSEWLVLVAGPDSDSLLLGHCFSDIHRAKVHAVLHEVRARCVLSR
jgi:hypothetical protein